MSIFLFLFSCLFLKLQKTAVARIRNVFGGAETFEANGSMGTKTRRAFRGAFSFPLTSNMSTTAELSAYGEERDLTTYASCFEGLRGSKAVIRVRFQSSVFI